MKSEWKTALLGDVITLKRGYDLPSKKRISGEIPIFSSSGISGTNDKPMCTPPGVITGRYGTIGQVFFSTTPYWPLNTTLYVEDFKGNDPKFIYYFLKTIHWEQFSGKSAVPGVNRNDVHRLEVEWPSIKEQERIAAILSSLDDKIELNQKINENLERQAQAIFAEHLLNDLNIPDGWRTGNLLEIADYLNGLAMQKYRPKDGEVGLPVLKIKELRQGMCDTSSELCSPSIKSEYVIHDGDVIFSWSGSLLVDFWCGGTCGLNQHLFKVTSKNYNKWFYYGWTLHHLNRFIAIAADKATTMGHIKREELAKAEVLIPSKSDYDKIGAVMGPIYDLIIANRLENRNLSEVRDTLLPKLMAGEIN